jgi:hypothetical protein
MKPVKVLLVMIFVKYFQPKKVIACDMPKDISAASDVPCLYTRILRQIENLSQILFQTYFNYGKTVVFEPLDQYALLGLYVLQWTF